MEYSASDYHHIAKPIPRSTTKGRLHSQTHTRRKSQFSIVSDEPRRNTPEKAQGSLLTQSSYDPYRSSRTPVTEAEAEYATITRRHSSVASRFQSLTHSRSPQHPAVSRLNPDEQPQSRSSSQNLRHGHSGNKQSQRASASRSSLASSRRKTSLVGVRTSSSYKRNVSFQHIRQRSISHPAATGGGHHPQFSFDQGHPSRPSSGHGPQPKHSSVSYQTPSSYTMPYPTEELDVKKPRVQSHYWRDDARKVSHELGKICEEAFNRSSVSSGATNGASRNRGTTQNTRLTGQDPVTHGMIVASNSRPLPRPPPESLNSYTLRELAETRRRLIEHCKAEGSEGIPDHLNGIIAHLDQLMIPIATNAPENGERRIASDPTTTMRDAGLLPPIFEESKGHYNDSKRNRKQASQNQRATSDPVQGKVHANRENFTADKTIRLVEPEALPPMEPVRPLNIRKKSDSSLTESLHTKSVDSLRSATKQPIAPDHALPRPTSMGSRRDSGMDGRYYGGLDTIVENPRSPRNVMGPGESRKRSWFKRNVQSPETIPPTPPRKDTPAPIAPSVSHSSNGSRAKDGSSHGDTDEKRMSGDGSRKWFTKVFGKSRAEKFPAEQPSHKIGMLLLYSPAMIINRP